MSTVAYDISRGVVVIIIMFILLSTTTVLNNSGEHYDYATDYNHAIRSGTLISGAVYASYPENVPGVGWIN